jgi:exodeoxyribonuclease VII large subunit
MMEKIFTVSQVNKIVKGMLSQNPDFANIEVEGEISNFHKYPSGHCYFNLKDERSNLKAVMFAGNARFLKASPLNGDKVIAVGRLDVYERDGVYQLYVDLLLPQGTGALMAAFEKLKNKLAAEGLFAPEKKQQLPAMVRKIGIITSSAGAAVRDVIKVSRSRNPGIELFLYPVRVQGEEAAGEIAHAIEYMNKINLVDVLIVGRGGGSMEDLWAFNEEVVVRAIAASQLPIVSAVGHETDFTLADFAADVRAATPSAAAEIVVQDVSSLSDKLAQLHKRLIRSLLGLYQVRLETMKRLSGSWVFRQPNRLWENKAQLLDQLSADLPKAMVTLLSNWSQRLALNNTKLIALNPMAVLARGYTITETEDGRLLKSAQEVKPGDVLVTRWAKGTALSKVIEGGQK